MSFVSYFELNLFIDVVIIVILSFTLYPKAPKFVLFLVILNLCQYFFPLNSSQTNSLSINAQDIKQSSKHYFSPLLDNNNNALKNASNHKPKKKFMGETPPPPENEKSPPPQEIPPIPKTLPPKKADDIYLTREEAIQNTPNYQPPPTATPPTPTFSPPTEEVELSPLSVFLDALSQPQAAWFLVRIAFLGITFALFLQSPALGILILSLNIIPIPYLFEMIPHIYDTLRSSAFNQELRLVFQNPAQIQHLLSSSWKPIAVKVLFLTIITLPFLFFGNLFKKKLKKQRLAYYATYLNPDAYQVKLNGNILNFEYSNNVITIGDLKFNVEAFKVDKNNPHIWRLGRQTTLEFVSRSI